MRIFLLVAFVFVQYAVAADKQDFCYMPYASTKDHMLLGCPVKGYVSDYSIAKQMGVFMILFEEKAYQENKPSPTYFVATTLSTQYAGFEEQLDFEINKIISEKPKPKVKRLNFFIKKANAKCKGAEVYREVTESPYKVDLFLFCKYPDSDYLGSFGYGAMTKNIAKKRKNKFYEWLNVPQMVRNMDIQIQQNLKTKESNQNNDSHIDWTFE